MKSAKEALRQTVETLSDEEARQVLELAQRLRRGKRDSQTLKRLAHDPAFHVPRKGAFTFRVVKPVEGKGLPASKLLGQDRR
ncbi:MAG TPA: hypothetical protein VGX03_27025 [Candidatus Binatia bacterium]|jgi:hypothetical protein|nr:hypothetical protein [Candidatus Binatia bacterium]